MARSIGHTSFGITLRHYVDPTVKATVDDQRVDTALARLRDSSSGKPAAPSPVQTLLRSLPESERAALLHALLQEIPVQ